MACGMEEAADLIYRRMHADNGVWNGDCRRLVLVRVSFRKMKMVGAMIEYDNNKSSTYHSVGTMEYSLRYGLSGTLTWGFLSSVLLSSLATIRAPIRAIDTLVFPFSMTSPGNITTSRQVRQSRPHKGVTNELRLGEDTIYQSFYTFHPPHTIETAGEVSS